MMTAMMPPHNAHGRGMFTGGGGTSCAGFWRWLCGCCVSRRRSVGVRPFGEGLPFCGWGISGCEDLEDRWPVVRGADSACVDAGG